jgi:hypothetical protein
MLINLLPEKVDVFNIFSTTLSWSGSEVTNAEVSEEHFY